MPIPLGLRILAFCLLPLAGHGVAAQTVVTVTQIQIIIETVPGTCAPSVAPQTGSAAAAASVAAMPAILNNGSSTSPGMAIVSGYGYIDTSGVCRCQCLCPSDSFPSDLFMPGGVVATPVMAMSTFQTVVVSTQGTAGAALDSAVSSAANSMSLPMAPSPAIVALPSAPPNIAPAAGSLTTAAAAAAAAAAAPLPSVSPPSSISSGSITNSTSSIALATPVAAQPQAITSPSPAPKTGVAGLPPPAAASAPFNLHTFSLISSLNIPLGIREARPTGHLL